MTTITLKDIRTAYIEQVEADLKTGSTVIADMGVRSERLGDILFGYAPPTDDELAVIADTFGFTGNGIHIAVETEPEPVDDDGDMTPIYR